MDENQIKEKIKIAESSISDLKDQTLREKAFEVVLSSLLQGIKSFKTTLGSGQKRSRKTSVVRAKRQPGRELQKTQLKFNESQLEELKQFYDKFSPSGSELCVFVLANFLRLCLKKGNFHGGDMEYCYQQLLSLNTTTRPLAMNSNQIRRALSWLVAPTRRKLWLELDGNGIYQVSSNGILKFKDLERELGVKGEEKTE